MAGNTKGSPAEINHHGWVRPRIFWRRERSYWEAFASLRLMISKILCIRVTLNRS